MSRDMFYGIHLTLIDQTRKACWGVEPQHAVLTCARSAIEALHRLVILWG